jgi:GntR family transcriptional regulator
MQRTIEIDTADPTPIWRQVEVRVRRLVAAGALAPAAPVPSVRELSRTLRINPATVAKAYQRLVDTGVLQVRRGEGTYVADHPPTIALAEREHTVTDGAIRYASLAMSVGASHDEAVTTLSAAWSDLAGQQEGAR